MQSGYCPFLAEPNKLCDIIAAGIVDEYLKRDPDSRVHISVSGGHGALFVAGELQSTADFDVSASVRRILGKYGIPEGLEPFIALEKIPSERIMHARQACIDPVTAFGYATKESESQIPLVQHLANKIAQTLEDKRAEDPEWFWMSRVGGVTVTRGGSKDLEITIRIDHGTQDLGSVRQEITKVIESQNLVESYKLHINPLGASDYHNLNTAIGQSGLCAQPYGSALPCIPNSSGYDWHKAKVIAPIIARNIAKRILKSSDSKAIMVRLVYMPGEDEPAQIWIRNEAGRDLSSKTEGMELHLQKAMDTWKQSDLMTQIAIHGIPGDQNFHWEI
ncbi:MAG: S-adenosylmethionine synthetase N-terminal domain-containing protein [Patescibacteria group bacterium]|nr:S-adenosylmethionine synthetase N-terminal domain-containing protein [Patescibacteria group bacterium]